jgi:hypothetical protein
MNAGELKKFLIDSNKAGYAAGVEKQWTKEMDGSTTIMYESGDWKSHDNFFGGEPYGGRIIVFFRGKPCWMMVYYGSVEKDIDPNTIYPVLRGALKRMPDEAPFRGPREFREGEYAYRNSWEGSVDSYSGEEEILQMTLSFTGLITGAEQLDRRGGV